MKFSLALLSGFLAATVLAVPSPDAESAALVEREATPEITARTSDSEVIKSSASDWASKEDTVSSFLDSAYAGKYHGQKAYVKAAKKAYKAHKSGYHDYEHLGGYLEDNQGYQNGNSTLADGGALETITDLLYELTTLSWKNDQTEIQDILDKILFGSGSAEGLCGAIIPAIDEILAAASDVLEDLVSGDTTLEGLTVNVPEACSSSKRRDVLYG